MSKTTEREISEAALTALYKSTSGKASYAELVEIIPTIIKLTSEDYESSDTRPNEAIWEQRLRNITSHKKSESNFIHEGLLGEIPGGLEITAEGRAYVDQR